MKKLLAGLLIGAGLVTGTMVEAAPVESLNIEQGIIDDSTIIVYNKRSGKKLTTNVAGYEVINPDRDSFSTERKVALINGKAPAKTPVTMKVFGTADLNKKNFNLSKLPSEDEYIEVSSNTIYTGNLGFFQNKLDLVLGINKIQINFDVEGVEPIEIIVYVYESVPTVTEIISIVN